MKNISSLRQCCTCTLSLIALATVTACGPTLRSKPAQVRAYRSTRACSQGPFVVDLPALGARWGEQIVITVWSGHAIAGRYDVSVGKEVVLRGRFGPSHHRYGASKPGNSSWGWRYVSAKAPDNRRCVSATATPVTASSTTGSKPGGSAGDVSPDKAKPAPRAAAAPPPGP